MNNLAIIPARSGSKGLKDKNIKNLCGKPLLAYSIEAALNSKQFGEVMVSTDSELYASIAKEYGANVPFLRSDNTSSDTATTWDMVEEVLGKYAEKGRVFDSFCVLQPTSPLRSSQDIECAYNLFRSIAEFAVISVCEAEHSPLWCGKLPENNEFLNFIDESCMNQRQSFGKYYRLNGAIYIVDTEKFKTDRFFYKQGSYAYIMPQERSIDIDTALDFKIAEVIMRDQ